MYRFLFFLLFSLSGSGLLAQQGNNTIELNGTIVDAENGAQLTGVHIVSNNFAATTTDIDGNFNLITGPGDTLLISHVGYNEYLVPIPEYAPDTMELKIGLTASLTELDEVVIYQWPATLSQLKQKILELEVEDEGVDIPGSYEGPPKPVTPGLGSPISFLQSKLSKKIRRRQEFLKKRQELEANQQALSRYNPQYVKEITGIESQQELDEFMTYFKLTDRFIAEVSEYDLIVAINQCYRDFKSERSE